MSKRSYVIEGITVTYNVIDKPIDELFRDLGEIMKDERYMMNLYNGLRHIKQSQLNQSRREL